MGGFAFERLTPSMDLLRTAASVPLTMSRALRDVGIDKSQHHCVFSVTERHAAFPPAG
jgi:hypothetical protein